MVSLPVLIILYLSAPGGGTGRRDSLDDVLDTPRAGASGGLFVPPLADGGEGSSSKAAKKEKVAQFWGWLLLVVGRNRTGQSK